MDIFTQKNFTNRKLADCLVIPFFEGDKPEESFVLKDFFKTKDLGPIKTKDFKGKKNEISLGYLDSIKEKRIILLGLGKKSDITLESLRRAYSKVIKSCIKLKLSNINLVFPTKIKTKCFSAVLESLFLSNYLFLRFKNDKDKNQPIEFINIIGVSSNKKEIENIKNISEGVCFARDLVNTNADDATPKRLKLVAEDLKKISPKIKVTVFDKKRIEKEKMDLLLAVNRGSFREPYFIIVEYKGSSKKEKTALIGKGITYDTGGLSLKPSQSMDTMKCDMAGAATVLATVYAAAKLNLKTNLTVIVPATENAIGSKSYKPGDVYNSYLKKTVEVENTDAEGRLILADAIAYAIDKIKPNRIIDLATLTGAVSIALGKEIAGVFSNDDSLFKNLEKASKKTSELIWRLPLHEDYKEMIKSNIADIKNVGGREAGIITSALFLKEFVKEGIPWAHIDIGGTAYFSKPKFYHTTLATGFGVRLLIQFLQDLQ